MTREDDETDTLIYECELDAPPEKVLRAVTVPEFLDAWIGVPPDADGEGEPSYRIIDETPSSVRYAWRDPQTDRPDSLVTIELDPAPGGRTFFRLTHGPRALLAANQNRPPSALAA